MEANIQKQDERAVESMIKCGLSLEAVYESFPQFDKAEIKELFDKVKGMTGSLNHTHSRSK